MDGLHKQINHINNFEYNNPIYINIPSNYNYIVLDSGTPLPVGIDLNLKMIDSIKLEYILEDISINLTTSKRWIKFLLLLSYFYSELNNDLNNLKIFDNIFFSNTIYGNKLNNFINDNTRKTIHYLNGFEYNPETLDLCDIKNPILFNYKTDKIKISLQLYLYLSWHIVVPSNSFNL